LDQMNNHVEASHRASPKWINYGPFNHLEVYRWFKKIEKKAEIWNMNKWWRVMHPW